MTDIRASEITEKMRIHEYGGLDDAFMVEKVDIHGDTVLVTATDSATFTFDIDEVVELLPSGMIMLNGKPVSACCYAEVERTCEYTDTHFFIVTDAETDETGKIISATYSFRKTYEGTDGDNVEIYCVRCGREISNIDDIEFQEG